MEYGMNETLDWSWRGMNENFNFGDYCDGYGGLHAAAVLLFSLHSLSTIRVQETFQLFLSMFLCSFCYTTICRFQLRFSSFCCSLELQIESVENYPLQVITIANHSNAFNRK